MLTYKVSADTYTYTSAPLLVRRTCGRVKGLVAGPWGCAVIKVLGEANVTGKARASSRWAFDYELESSCQLSLSEHRASAR
jgi:hypothetical protein